MGKLVISVKPTGQIKRGPGAKKKRKNRARIPGAVKEAVYARDGGRCVVCKKDKKQLKKIGSILTYDHKIPVRVGGGNTIENLQLMCDVCNEWKGDRL